jgi:hypothetical protein
MLPVHAVVLYFSGRRARLLHADKAADAFSSRAMSWQASPCSCGGKLAGRFPAGHSRRRRRRWSSPGAVLTD